MVSPNRYPGAVNDIDPLIMDDYGYPPDDDELGMAERGRRFSDPPECKEVVRHQVWLIDMIIVVEVVYHIVVVGLADWKIAPLRRNPLFGVDAAVLDKYGLKHTFAILGGQWWRLVATLFQHAGAIDLAVHIIILLFIGIPLESSFGGAPVGVIYISSGIIGVVSSMVFAAKTLGVGSSGAVAGLIGARIADLSKHGLRLRGNDSCQTGLITLTLTAVLAITGTMPLTDSFSMIVGLLAGFVAGWALLRLSVEINHVRSAYSLTFLELIAGLIWAALFVASVMNLNQLRLAQTCYYCKLPQWLPGCSEHLLWSCRSESIK